MVTDCEDKLQSLLWCLNQIITCRKIKKPRRAEAIVVNELNAYAEIRLILKED